MNDFMLTHRIELARAAVGNWSEEDVLRGAASPSVVPDAMATFLRHPPITTPETMANVLLSYVILYAMEQTESLIAERDDEESPLYCSGRYGGRQNIFMTCLFDIAQSTPLHIAGNSSWALSGLNMTMERQGWDTYRVQQGWAAVKGAIAPFCYAATVKRTYRR